MALTTVDRNLLQACLKHEPGSWNDFVDRFIGLVYHVIHFTAHLRSNPLKPEEVEDIAQEIFIQIINNDYQLLRQFRGKSSLATYLTVIARRICVQQLIKLAPLHKPLPEDLKKDDETPNAGIERVELVQQLLRKLPSREREVVRMFYLEGRTYEEISSALNIPVNTIGPVLSRAKKKLKNAS